MNDDKHVDQTCAPCRSHVRKCHRASFWAAQGDQSLQVHFVFAYTRYMRLDGVPLDLTARDALLERARNQRLPAGQKQIPDLQCRAQNEFWWWNVWDILAAVYADAPEALPSRADINDRAHAVGGNPEMSSFTDAEMTALARTFARYRRGDVGRGPDAVIETLFLPNVIRVELGFQGHSPRYPKRPRTDGGDAHASRLLMYCIDALTHYQAGAPDIVDRIYRVLCGKLSRLADVDASDPVQRSYQALVSAYNATHPHHAVPRLHVPYGAFPASTSAPARVAAPSSAAA